MPDIIIIMKKFHFTPGTRGLIILAHPDDETIWLGGTIMMNPKIDWTVLCLSRSQDPDRRPKFTRVAHKLGFKFFHENLDDMERMSFLRHIASAKQLIKKNIGSTEFDFVITHGVNGEYGHRDHKSIHEAVRDLAERGILKTKAVLYLHMKRPKKRVPLLIPRAKSDMIINLPRKIYEAKKDVMSNIYGFDRNGIDASYCTALEAFAIKYYN